MTSGSAEKTRQSPPRIHGSNHRMGSASATHVCNFLSTLSRTDTTVTPAVFEYDKKLLSSQGSIERQYFVVNVFHVLFYLLHIAQFFDVLWNWDVGHIY